MTSLDKRKASLAVAVAVAALALVAVEPALAQPAAGPSTAGGAFTSVYNWFMTNVWAGMVLLGVVCVGLMFWFGKIAVFIIAMAAAGGLVVKFAPDIQAFFT